MRGRGGALRKVLFGGAIVAKLGALPGRAGFAVIPDAGEASPAAFLEEVTVEPGARVLIDGCSAQPPATREAYIHRRRPVVGSGVSADNGLCVANLVFPPARYWIMGTLRGLIWPEHIRAYLYVLWNPSDARPEAA